MVPAYEMKVSENYDWHKILLWGENLSCLTLRHELQGIARHYKI